MLARRHMEVYGTRRDHFAEIAISAREHARTRPTSLMREPLTVDEYFDAPMISDPLCLYDYCLESDGAVAVIVSSVERARSLRQPPVLIASSVHGGSGQWGKAIEWMGMEDAIFASSGVRSLTSDLYGQSGIKPSDIDVALLYDHFTPMVLMQLEDLGLSPIGEGGDYVMEGNIRWPVGSVPVNTHGGNLSEAYIMGMTHILEATEQLRGTAVNQVKDAEIAVVTGGAAGLPVSAAVLTSD